MRKFYFEMEISDNHYRIFMVKACTLKGAFKRARKYIKRDEFLYQICTRIKGSSLKQPIWDFMNGNIKKYYEKSGYKLSF